MTPSNPRLRHTLAILTAGTALFLTGCTPEPPSITWYGNREATNVGPAFYCDYTDSNRLEVACSVQDGPAARLSLRTGDTVQINIPADVAEKPWLLVVSYADDGESFRTPVFTDGGTLSYVVTPEPGRQLQQIDLQVLTVTADAAGQPQYTPYQVWVLQIDPA